MSRAQQERRLAQERKDRAIGKLAGPASGVFLITFAFVGICYYRDIGWLGRHGRVILDFMMIAFLIALSFLRGAAARRRNYWR